MKFIIMVCATFLARVKPVSTSANPACMNMTRKPVSSVHITLIETRLWPANSATSVSVGLPASLAVTSPMPPVAVPAGSGFDGGGAGAAAGAGVAGAAGLSWANTQPPTARRQASTRPKTILHGSERVPDPGSFMHVSPSAAACRRSLKKERRPYPGAITRCDLLVARHPVAARDVPWSVVNDITNLGATPTEQVPAG